MTQNKQVDLDCFFKKVEQLIFGIAATSKIELHTI